MSFAQKRGWISQKLSPDDGSEGPSLSTAQVSNIRIAERCGWRNASTIFGALMGYHGDAFHQTEIPDYFEDLNAMNEAENTLNDEEHARYRSLLFSITENQHGDNWSGDTWDRAYCSASASQRAQAFLATIQ